MEQLQRFGSFKATFHPVQFTAIQAHTRQQGAGETVDQFAQELRKLFRLAYAGAACEGPQAERMGQTLLINEFVAGLRSELKWKLDGGLEELILKAKLEEAKSVGAKSQMRETPVSKSSKPPSGVGVTAAPTAGSVTAGSVGTRSSRGKCFNCGLEGHLARACPYPKKGKRDEEAHGQRGGTTMSALVGDKDSLQEQVKELEQRLQDARLQLAVRGKSRMSTVAASVS